MTLARGDFMLSLTMAQQLKDAGLGWRPALHDFFAIPGVGMDDRRFVLTDMMAYQELMRGWPVVTFHGAVEWALDYVLVAEALWLPSETQLREMLQDWLLAEEQPAVTLQSMPGGYVCQIHCSGVVERFEGITASDAYAAATIFVLQLRLSAPDHEHGA